MSMLRVVLKEVGHRAMSFTLGLLAVTAAVALFVALTTTGRASNTETIRLMRNLGFNVLVLPEGTDLARFWSGDEVSGDMPDEYVKRLANTPGLSADHYVATLQKKVTWRGLQVLLTGLLPEQTALDARKKAPMGHKIATGVCYIGFAIWDGLGLAEGDTIDLLGKSFTVERCLAEDGSKQDVTIYTRLSDAQQLLGMEGRINMIQALGCLCKGGSLAMLRDEISRVLPGTYVTELRNIVKARTQTRKMVEGHVGFIMAMVMVICVAWVGLLALLNVRERRHEIGVLRALGFATQHVAGLFIARAALMGILGALVGFAVGTAVAMHYGPELFKITFGKVRPAWDLLVPVLAAAPLVAALAGLLPAMIAVTQDPAEVLMEE